MRAHHFLLVCFPVHGHINPSLELAHRLTNLGHHVTFATTVAANRRLTNTTTPHPLLTFAPFSDGCDHETLNPNRTFPQLFSDFKHHGSQSLTKLITSHNEQSPSNPFTFVIYSLLFHWVADVAAALHIPSALLFVQPATLLALYYHYFHGYGDTIPNKKLPGLPLLTEKDMPSFLSPTSPHSAVLPFLKQQIELLDQKSQSKVLINSFDALEEQTVKAIDGLKMIPIGPLISIGKSNGKNGSNPLFESENYMEWLNSKAKSSVIYVSFGSVSVLQSKQAEEIMKALNGYTFLWVKIDEEAQEKENGKIVRWCRQDEVLNHPSVGCFMSHCGWNSTIEGMAVGVPLVAFPLQIDQATNAKLVEDVWKIGVRVAANSEGFVEGEEIRRCLDLIMGSEANERRDEIVGNAKKWKDLATQAIGQHGSSTFNLKAFVEDIDNSD
ncbi:crocetin glucosyltransferase, chloroplastic-like [Cucurbita moschata]|uniref:Glycosyltransferase n=1 Tax=Cucurbita moschata TaxID=3662 RepID=A0A6J1H6U6_CUCMO|nr:crocetin glucosyltransferase, chloroplastic-like [Cucurbita moschata]